MRLWRPSTRRVLRSAERRFVVVPAPEGSLQQLRLQTTRPSGHVVGAPVAQVILHPLPSQRHFEVSLQATVHVPAHSTPHEAELLQVTAPPAPTLTSQSALLLQVTVDPAPAVRSQVELFPQVMVLFAPTSPEQVAAPSHSLPRALIPIRACGSSSRVRALASQASTAARRRAPSPCAGRQTGRPDADVT